MWKLTFFKLLEGLDEDEERFMRYFRFIQRGMDPGSGLRGMRSAPGCVRLEDQWVFQISRCNERTGSYICLKNVF